MGTWDGTLTRLRREIEKPGNVRQRARMLWHISLRSSDRRLISSRRPGFRVNPDQLARHRIGMKIATIAPLYDAGSAPKAR